MGEHCCPSESTANINDAAYRKTLWVVLVINILMFAVEIISGFIAGSTSLQADALDFLGDAANYSIALYVLNKSAKLKAYSSLVKSFTMIVLGLWVLGYAIYKVFVGVLPSVEIMSFIGFVALAANILCLVLLSRHARSDINRESVWLCSRNDVIANISVLVAAYLVHITNSLWPDIVVAVLIASLCLKSAFVVIKKAKTQL